MTQTRRVLLIPSGGLVHALVPGDLLTHFSWLLLLPLGSPRTFYRVSGVAGAYLLPGS